VDLDPDACYRALRTRDARFDGRFFTAVRTTGIYCRPVCPARTPKRQNCVFLPCAAAAQEAGYRPCLRCRPEASPGTPAWLGTSASVSRALRLIDDGALDHGGVGDLAARLGIGERHLRRLFLEHLGATPVAVAQTRRVLFAKKLIDETDLAMAQVAFASGFSSIRRFNAAMLSTYGRSPRELRGRPQRDDANESASEISLRLTYRPPLDWKAMRDFLALRATPGVERVGPDFYRRTWSHGDAAGVLEVRPVADENHLMARIRSSGPTELIHLVERLRAMFDLTADPGAIAERLRRDRRLGRAVRTRPGLRVPGAWSGFELAVRAVLGQQVTVKGATTLAGRLVEAHGESVPAAGDAGVDRLFPRPEVLAGADLSRIGLPGARAEAISQLARAVSEGSLALDPSVGLDETIDRLCRLPGLGDWTAQYIAMRARGEPDAFPASDLGLRRALGDNGRPLTARRVGELAEAWRPWRAYAAMHIWMSI
jgi:AraC family transcriptional regulator of adaptative response / DNA-3-methyladenine glycosylase II